ncbi:MAG TPA: SsrA-binding protein SmpB [Abditibacteriaceae bacterium]|nr:SsrA-binding protein SmpB [Abditibacteriaceae bacterium]
MRDQTKKISGDQTVAVNRRGRFDYDIEESLEAGLMLTGTEVKSARQGQVQLSEAYASLEPGPTHSPEVWIHGMHIAPYKQGNVFNAEPRRKRKLLLHRHQIDKLIGRVQQKGQTLVPLKFYFTRGRAKLELGIGKGRKQYDKRHAIAEREIRREMQSRE